MKIVCRPNPLPKLLYDGREGYHSVYVRHGWITFTHLYPPLSVLGIATDTYKYMLHKSRPIAWSLAGYYHLLL